MLVSSRWLIARLLHNSYPRFLLRSFNQPRIATFCCAAPGSVALQLAAISQSVKSLSTQLRQFEARPGDFGINRAELARRRSLIEGLEKQLATLSGSSSNSGARTAATAGNGRLAQQRETMREHDRIVEDLGKGVSRLHQTSTMINDEANLHVRLLSDMDVDVERASAGLRQEAQHAERVSLLAICLLSIVYSTTGSVSCLSLFSVACVTHKATL
jgi:hypothetical protein